MLTKLQTTLLAAAGLLICQSAAFGQVEVRPAKVMEADKASIAELSKTADSVWKAHLDTVLKTGDLKLISNAARVAKDVNGKSAVPYVFYTVSPMSEIQYLPDAYPLESKVVSPVRILMAGDEYEPGSFVIYPLKNLGKVKMTLSQFRTKDGKVFPAEELDLKVVKVWYQSQNGWYSYFADYGRKLTPELLLNDEDLIKVDTKAGHNYARLTEKNGEVHYHWLTTPHEYANRYMEWNLRGDLSTFPCMKENFYDAATFRPVLLEEGSFKQFFLTAHAKKGQPAGLYSGSIKLADAKTNRGIGEIPVAIRVLPFDLPQPMTYLNLNKPFLVTSYHYLTEECIMSENGGDRTLARKQLESILKNQVRHNQVLHFLPGTPVAGRTEEFAVCLDIIKKAGMRTDYILGDYPTYSNLVFDAKFKHDWYLKHYGHLRVFFSLGDEPPSDAVVSYRPTFRIYQDQGFEFTLAGSEYALFKAGYVYGFFSDAKPPDGRGTPHRWNEIRDTILAWYANQHVGPENPAFNRRQNGMAPYLSGYSALCNYAHHLGAYNDAAGWLYRPMVFAYGSHDGVIDTLQWEGFREGVDDIRYATLMKTLAAEALKSEKLDVRYAGGQANQFLALLETNKGDLDTIRKEMILHILKLKKMLGK